MDCTRDISMAHARERPVTRAMANETGRRRSAAAVIGDFLVVELNGNNELPWMIGEVIKKVHKYEGEGESEQYTGTIRPGDEVVHLRRWMPLQNGGGGNQHSRRRGSRRIFSIILSLSFRTAGQHRAILCNNLLIRVSEERVHWQRCGNGRTARMQA